jgi:ribosomal protein S18 acetylase RimI-like enzyme
MSAFSRQPDAPLCIREAVRRDLPPVADLWVELISLHAQLDPRFSVPANGRANYLRHLHQSVRDPNHRLLVAEAGAGLAGYILGYIAHNPPIFPAPYYGFISDLYVCPTCRRQGAGSELVRALCSWFRAQGLCSIQLNVAHHNPHSQAFWRKVGCTDYLDHMWLALDGTEPPGRGDTR